MHHSYDYAEKVRKVSKDNEIRQTLVEQQIQDDRSHSERSSALRLIICLCTTAILFMGLIIILITVPLVKQNAQLQKLESDGYIYDQRKIMKEVEPEGSSEIVVVQVYELDDLPQQYDESIGNLEFKTERKVQNDVIS